MQLRNIVRWNPITRRRVQTVAMASHFEIIRKDGDARLGRLQSPDGKELATPALLLSTTHGHCLENDNSAIKRWNQQHADLAVAVSGIHMCGSATAELHLIFLHCLHASTAAPTLDRERQTPSFHEP